MASEPGYIIVRDIGRTKYKWPSGTVRPGTPLGPPKTLGQTLQNVQSNSRQGTVELKIETGLDKKDADDARKDEKTIGVAKIMPTSLIAPFDAAPAAGKGNWGIEEVGAAASKADGTGVKVAVLDTGIHRSHKAFDNMNILEQDFTGDGNGDRQGHGTHCAGTVFGRDIDGVRIGVARGVTDVLIGKVLGDKGGGNTEMLFRGLDWAIANGADVISMSLGFDFPGYVQDLVDDGWPADLATSNALVSYRDNLRLLDNVMERVRILADSASGAVIAAASGNESKASAAQPYRIAVSLPAAAMGMISVGALDREGDELVVADFSNTLPRLTAPGVGILSAQSGTEKGLVALSGTSMACPHVAGVAALWWQHLRAKSPGNVKVRHVEAALLSNARIEKFKSTVDPVDRGDGAVAAP